MAVTKILARHYRIDAGINYVLNGDKTEEQLLTDRQYCTPGHEYMRMMATKEKFGNTEKRKYTPNMTLHLKAEIMKFGSYKEQFAFLREHDMLSA